MQNFTTWLLESVDPYKVAANKRSSVKQINNVLDSTNDEDTYLQMLHTHPSKLTTDTNETHFDKGELEYRDTHLAKLIKNTDSPEVLDAAFQTYKHHPDENIRSGLYKHILNHPAILDDSDLYDKVIKTAHSDQDVMNTDYNNGHQDIFNYREKGVGDFDEADTKYLGKMQDQIEYNQNIHRFLIQHGGQTEKLLSIAAHENPSERMIHDTIHHSNLDEYGNSAIPEYWSKHLSDKNLHDVIDKGSLSRHLVRSPNFGIEHLKKTINAKGHPASSEWAIDNEKLQGINALNDSDVFKNQRNGLVHKDVIKLLSTHKAGWAYLDRLKHHMSDADKKTVEKIDWNW